MEGFLVPFNKIWSQTWYFGQNHQNHQILTKNRPKIMKNGQKWVPDIPKSSDLGLDWSNTYNESIYLIGHRIWDQYGTRTIFTGQSGQNTQNHEILAKIDPKT